jgi:hypothetical protein
MKDDKTGPVRIDKDVIRDIKMFVAANGGSIKALLEHGAVYVMSKGAKEYINKLKK